MSTNWSAVGAVATGLAALATTLAAVAANRGLTLARKGVESAATSSNIDRRMYSDALVTNLIFAVKEFCAASSPYAFEKGHQDKEERPRLLDSSSAERIRLDKAMEDVRIHLDVLELAGLNSISLINGGGTRIGVTTKVIGLACRILYHIIIYPISLSSTNKEIFDYLLEEQVETGGNLWKGEEENDTEVVDRFEVLFNESLDGRSIKGNWTQESAQNIFTYLLDDSLRALMIEYQGFADTIAPWILTDKKLSRRKKLVNWAKIKMMNWVKERKLSKWFDDTKLIKWIDYEL